MSERLIELITNLPITKAFERNNIYKNYHYERFGYMLLPDIPTVSNIFNRNFITFWTKLLRDGPVEKVFNQEFKVIT